MIAAKQKMESAGIRKRNAWPPFFHILHKMGHSPRPPHYASFAQIWLWLGCYFALAWGVLMYLIFWAYTALPIWISVLVSLLAGALFGYLMARHYSKSRIEHGLSDWDQL